MLVNDRTHPLEQDLAWVPARMKRWRWLARSRNYEPASDPFDVLGPLMLVPVLGELAMFLAWTFKDRSATYDNLWLQRHLDRLGARERTLANVGEATEGERVLVRGRVSIDVPLRGVLHESQGVSRRLAFRAQGRWWIHEAAVDFRLVAEDGKSVPVQAAGARLVSRLGEPAGWPAALFVADTAPHGVRARFDADRSRPVRAAERVLQAGEQVTVLAHRTSVPDPAGASSGYREPPRRAALTGSAAVPLLIVPSIELARP